MEHMSHSRIRTIMRSALTVIVAGLLVYFFLARIGDIAKGVKSVISILSPFVAGALFAFILKPLCNRLDPWFENLFVSRLAAKRIASGKTTEKRARAAANRVTVLITTFLFLLVVTGVGMLVIPGVIRSINELRVLVPEYFGELGKWFDGLNQPDKPISMTLYKLYRSVVENFSGNSSGILSSLVDNALSLVSTVGSVVVSVLNFLVDILVTVVSTVYILMNRKRFAQQANLVVHAVCKKKTADWLIREAQFANRKFSEFFTGKMLDSFIVGCILYVTLAIVRIQNAPLIAVFMAFCNMIPFFGPYIGAFPCMFLVFMAHSDNPIMVIYFLIVVVVVQQLDGNILDPYIVGDNIGLSGFWVLFAVIVFGDLFGFIGLLIGVPLFAVIYDMIRQLVHWGLKKRGQEELITNYNFIYHDPEEERAAMKKRAAAIKAARLEARDKAIAERQEAMARELAQAQAAAAAREKAEAEAVQEGATLPMDLPEDPEE